MRCETTRNSCATYSAPVTFTVARVSPVITSVTPSRFSPNGDGRYETTNVHYKLDSPQTVTLRVTTTHGALVRGPVKLGHRSAGAYSYAWNGHNNVGSALPSGGYVVKIDTTATVHGTTVTGHAERGVIVDVTAPASAASTRRPAPCHPPINDPKTPPCSREASTRLSHRCGPRCSTLPAARCGPSPAPAVTKARRG